MNTDVVPYEHSWTAYRPTNETFSATGAKYHWASLEVNTTPVLIIIIISFVFIITQCIFVMSFNASGTCQLYSNWVLSVKLCKINFDTLSLKCPFCSVSLEWNVLIPAIFFRENSSPSSCCYPSNCNTAKCVISWLYLILWFLLNKSTVTFKVPFLCLAIITRRSVSVHLSKNMTDANFLVLKPCITH